MQSAVVKRSIVITGHKTSISLEDPFWSGLKEIGKEHKKTLSNLVAGIDERRQSGNLSSAIRLFVLNYFHAQAPTVSADRVAAGTEASQGTHDGRQFQQVNGQIGECPLP
jgi:predicted DNA-binding ribbon-helix-helix protein